MAITATMHPRTWRCDLEETSRRLVAEGAELLVRGDVHSANEAFDTAVTMAPSVAAWAWQRGFGLYYVGRYEEARQHFALTAVVDRNDVEPVLWKFVCDVKLYGLARAREELCAFDGYDKRPCMMAVLDVFKGEITAHEALCGAHDDRLSLCRPSFNCGLFYEAIGDIEMARKLMAVAADAGSGGLLGGCYVQELARFHLLTRLGNTADASVQQKTNTSSKMA